MEKALNSKKQIKWRELAIDLVGLALFILGYCIGQLN